jgi:predicted RNase H-like HicB family nuclease
MKSTDYPVFLVFSKEDNAWLARVDLLPGCAAEGGTQEEALVNVRKAIKTWIEVSKELGRKVPKALDMQEIEDL